MMNFDLFHDPVFIVFTISNFCTSIGFNVPYVYLAAQADVLGINKEQASYLLAVIGIANTVGRIILGYLADKPWVNRLLVYNVCLTCCGIGMLLLIRKTKFFTKLIITKSRSYCFFGVCCGLLFVGRLCGRFWLYNRRLRWLDICHFGGSVRLGETDKCFWAFAFVPGYSLVGGTSVCWHIIRYDRIVFARVYLSRRNHYNQWRYLVCHSTNAKALRCKKIGR